MSLKLGRRGRVAGPVLLLAAIGMLFLAGCESPAMRLRNEGLRLYHQGHYQAAVRKFDDALNYNQSEPHGNYYAGAADYMLGRYEQAIYHYKLALQTNPNYGQAKSALAQAYIKEGKPNEAMNTLERIAALTGRVGDRLRVARFYARLGDLDDARVNYMKAATMAPNDPVVLIAVGKFFDRIGRRKQAVGYYEQAYRMAPPTPGLVKLLSAHGATIYDALTAPPAAPSTAP